MEEKRDILINFRLTDEEYKILLKRQRSLKTKSVSSTVRRLIDPRPIVVIDPKDVLKLTYQISKIGNNINQIVDLANFNDRIPYNDIVDVKMELSYINKLLKKLIRIVK